MTKANTWKSSNQFDTPQPGNRHYVVTLTLVNGGRIPLDYNLYHYKLEDNNGVQTPPVIGGIGLENKMGPPHSLGDVLRPGTS